MSASDADELAALGSMSLSGNFLLGADIDMQGVSMQPISSLYGGTGALVGRI